MNILVTGASGFIGKALVQRLAWLNHAVYGLGQSVLRHEPTVPFLKEYFHQDLAEPFHIDIPFDFVFHLGALNVTHVDQAPYRDYHRVNVLGTENLLRAVNARQFVFMSTAKVYRQTGGNIDESSPLGPLQDYEKSKLEAEEVCRGRFSAEDLSVFRAVNIVGPGQAEKAVIPVFFNKALKNEPLEVIYSSKTPLQMLYVDDLLDAFIRVMEHGQGVGTVNLASDKMITLGTLAEAIVAVCGSSSKIISLNDEDVLISRILSTKAKTVLHWQALTAVEDILKKYHDYIVATQ